jgi:hypothetical protein
MMELVRDSEIDELIGLPVDQKRDLIRWGAARPDRSSPGRGGGRAWSRRTFRRLARIKALNAAGLSLRMSHTLTYLYVLDERFDLIDPGAPPEHDNRTWAKFYRWFEPDYVMIAHDTDLHLLIINGKLIFQAIGSPRLEMVPTGILESNGTVFRTGIDFSTNPIGRNRAQWQRPDGTSEIDPKSLAWKFDHDLVADGWHEQLVSHISLLKINLSLATRVAMRGLLGLPVRYSWPEAATEADALLSVDPIMKPDQRKRRAGAKA